MKYKVKQLWLLLALMFVLLPLTSCRNNHDKSALVYVEARGSAGQGKVESMSESMYSLWLSYQKSMYSFLAGNEASWDQRVADDISAPTLAEFVKQQSTESAKRLLCVSHIFDNVEGLKLTNAEKDDITEKVTAFGNNLGISQRDVLDEYLSTFGANSDTLNEYYTFVSKYDKLYRYYFEQDGIYKVSQEEIKDYFEKEYCIVDHIFINVGTQTKSDGTSVQLTEEERENNQKTADDIYNRLMAGEDFETLKKEYTQDAYGVTMYPQGFFVTNDGSFTSEFEKAALEMTDGEIRKVESTNNGVAVGIHIMKKYPMDKEKYNLYQDILKNMTDELSSRKFNQIIDEYLPNVKENKNITDLFDIKLISALG